MRVTSFLGVRPILTWCSYLSSQSPSTAGTQLFSSWQRLGPRHACNRVIPHVGMRISVGASLCPQTAFSILRRMFLLLSQHVAAASPEKRAFVPVVGVPEFLYARVAVVLVGVVSLLCKAVVVCSTAGWSDNRGIRAVGDQALMRVSGLLLFFLMHANAFFTLAI